MLQPFKRTPIMRTKPAHEPKRRTRKCAVAACRQPFEPRNMTHKACSIECALALAEQLRAKADRMLKRTGLEKLKRRADHLKDTERVCNTYVRIRDLGKPCISCGRIAVSAWHAGHYMSVGARPALRFNQLNIHRQCKQCNVDFHGNIAAYRIGLIDRIGLAAVEWLEGPHEPAKYTIEQAKSIAAEYRAKIKELKGKM